MFARTAPEFPLSGWNRVSELVTVSIRASPSQNRVRPTHRAPTDVCRLDQSSGRQYVRPSSPSRRSTWAPLRVITGSPVGVAIAATMPAPCSIGEPATLRSPEFVPARRTIPWTAGRRASNRGRRVPGVSRRRGGPSGGFLRGVRKDGRGGSVGRQQLEPRERPGVAG